MPIESPHAGPSKLDKGVFKRIAIQSLGPLAAAAFPLLSIYSDNLDWVAFRDVLPLLGILLAGAAVVFGVVAGVYRSLEKGALVSTALIVVLFLYGRFLPDPKFGTGCLGCSLYDLGVLLVGYWVCLIAVAVFSIYCVRTKRSLAVFAQVSRIFLLAILAVPVATSTWTSVRRALLPLNIPTTRSPSLDRQTSGNPQREVLPSEVSRTMDQGPRPDIYYIILDGHTRGDVLRDLYGVDNSAFLDGLRQRGFYVAPQSHTNYLQTTLSLASSLNMSYLKDFDHASYAARDYRSSLVQAFEHNVVVRELRSRGYTYVRTISGLYVYNEDPLADVFLEPEVAIPSARLELLDRLLRLTPFPEALDAMSRWEVDTVRFQFSALQTRIPDDRRPVFVFAHILCPHPPFVFDRNGNVVYSLRYTGLADASDYPESKESYRSGYGEQVRFVDDQVLRTVDSILARYSPQDRPVIIIQGDHGGGLFYDQEKMDASMFWERGSILNAYLLPPGHDAALYESISPVNSFRVVFNELFGARLDLLPDRTYFAPFSRPDIQTEVPASALEKPVNVPPPDKPLSDAPYTPVR